MRRSQRVSIDEPSEENTIKTLQGIKGYYETYTTQQLHKKQ